MKLHSTIDSDLADWIAAQKMFFVATAPMSQEGHINLSPKGGESFRVLSPTEDAYLDYTGSGAETAAHVRENGRIVVMFCAFEGPPQIARLYGTGRVLTPGTAGFDELAQKFPSNPGTRSIVHISVNRISTSCGYSVPFYDFRGHRDGLDKWARTKGPAGLDEYRAAKNRLSIDELPAFD